jgi:hypothetical protein
VNNVIEVLMGIFVGNSNKLHKGFWKENSIECIQTWANDIRYNSVSRVFIIIIKKRITCV